MRHKVHNMLCDLKVNLPSGGSVCRELCLSGPKPSILLIICYHAVGSNVTSLIVLIEHQSAPRHVARHLGLSPC